MVMIVCVIVIVLASVRICVQVCSFSVFTIAVGGRCCVCGCDVLVGCDCVGLVGLICVYTPVCACMCGCSRANVCRRVRVRCLCACLYVCGVV